MRCWPFASFTTTTRTFFSFSGDCTSLYGVSPIDLPAYFVSIGFGSKLSMWLTPPRMKSQITRFAFCGKIGSPVGGCQAVLRPHLARQHRADRNAPQPAEDVAAEEGGG